MKFSTIWAIALKDENREIYDEWLKVKLFFRE
jgi:hypothetical protein